MIYDAHKRNYNANRKQIKSENLVTMCLWSCNDSEAGHHYNHEYTIANEITGLSRSYSKYHDGDYFKTCAEEQYNAQVGSNRLIIERVKAFLNDQSN